jgi:hypothetical protein
MPSKAYKEHFALSYSGMKLLKRSPQHLMAWYSSPDRDETRSMALGTLNHLLLLEPHREKTDLAIWTGKVKNGKAWEEFEAQNADKMIIKPKDLEDSRAMIRSVLANPFVKKALGQPGKAELEFYGVDPVFECPVKCAFDWITDDLVLDLKKTAKGVSEFESRSIWDYDYHVQAAFYLRLAEIMDGRKRQFGWVVVEEEAPNACVLVLPRPEHIELGNAVVEDMLGKFSICYRDQTWPGYEAPMKLAEIPDWVLRRKQG